MVSDVMSIFAGALNGANVVLGALVVYCVVACPEAMPAASTAFVPGACCRLVVLVDAGTLILRRA